MAPSLKTTLNKINRSLENNVKIANKVIEENVRNVTKAAKKVPWLHVVIGVVAVAIILYCIWKLLRPKKGRKEGFGERVDWGNDGGVYNKYVNVDYRMDDANDKVAFFGKTIGGDASTGIAGWTVGDPQAAARECSRMGDQCAGFSFNRNMGGTVWFKKGTETDGRVLRGEATPSADNSTDFYVKAATAGTINFSKVPSAQQQQQQQQQAQGSSSSTATNDPTWKAKVNIIINGDDMNTKTNGTEFMGKNMGESDCMKAVKSKGKDMVYGHHTTECWAKFINKGNFKNMTVAEENGNWTSASFDPQMQFGLPNINSLKSEIEKAKGIHGKPTTTTTTTPANPVQTTNGCTPLPKSDGACDHYDKYPDTGCVRQCLDTLQSSCSTWKCPEGMDDIGGDDLNRTCKSKEEKAQGAFSWQPGGFTYSSRTLQWDDGKSYTYLGDDGKESKKSCRDVRSDKKDGMKADGGTVITRLNNDNTEYRFKRNYLGKWNDDGKLEPEGSYSNITM
jgi:hypothetical protein